jgi:hypothetical protein
MFQIPPNAKVYEFPTSTFWFDEDGIMWSISKKRPPQTIEQARDSIDRLKEITNNKKVCMLIDVTNTSESSRELRDYAAEELPKLVKAIAMVSSSALGKMLANLFFSLKSQPYPVKMFNDEKEALAWLRQYL